MKARCGVIMPKAQEPCARGEGHAGGHSSAASMEQARERNARYYANNAATVRGRTARYRANNAEKVREQRARYRAANAEKEQERNARWCAENAEKLRERNARRRARVAGAVSVPYDRAEAMPEGATCWCGAPADHLDHMFPIVDGGHDSAYNVVPMCARHNLEKGAKDPADWVASLVPDHLREALAPELTDTLDLIEQLAAGIVRAEVEVRGLAR